MLVEYLLLRQRSKQKTSPSCQIIGEMINHGTVLEGRGKNPELRDPEGFFLGRSWEAPQEC